MGQRPDLDFRKRIDQVLGPDDPVMFQGDSVAEPKPSSPEHGSGNHPDKLAKWKDPKVVEGLLGTENPHILTAKEQFAAVGAYTLGAFALVVILILLVLHALALPHPPSLDGLKPDDPNIKVMIDNYRQLSEIADRSLATTFDLLITKPLLPLLGTLVGYIIGQSNKKSSG